MAVTQSSESWACQKVDWCFLQGPLYIFDDLSLLAEHKNKRNAALYKAKSPSRLQSCLQQCPVKDAWENHSIWVFSGIMVLLACSLKLEHPTLFLIMSLPLLLPKFFFQCSLIFLAFATLFQQISQFHYLICDMFSVLYFFPLNFSLFLKITVLQNTCCSAVAFQTIYDMLNSKYFKFAVML